MCERERQRDLLHNWRDLLHNSMPHDCSIVHAYMSVCVSVCVCERERVCLCMCVYVCVRAHLDVKIKRYSNKRERWCTR